MRQYHDTLSFNPFIHGTSSQTLSMMQHTHFQLMPVIAMLQEFKVAPMVGELTQGGFGVIGDGFNGSTMSGAPAFGRMHHAHYDLNRVIRSYTNYSHHLSLDVCKENFKDILGDSHKSAFTRLNLLMIYLVRLRQLGVKAGDLASLSEIDALKERLNATVEFYYFVLCIQKHIFIDVPEMQRFRTENNLDDVWAVGDYIEHYFSFENVLEKLRKTEFNVEEIYASPSPENIGKLIEFVKISKDSQENVKRYPDGQDHFIAKRDYSFFKQQQDDLECQVQHHEMSARFFTNGSGCSLDRYLEQYYKTYRSFQEKRAQTSSPDFKGFHEKVMPYIDALKDRIALCRTLLDADDDEFVPHNKSDTLLIKPFPVVFVTEVTALEVFCNEYRSRAPLKLGKEILLIATDNTENQKRLRDYLQENNVGPVEVLLFDDLHTLRSRPEANYFDSFANDDLIKAFELAQQKDCLAQFSKLYRALSELNEKRYRFRSTNQEMYLNLNKLFVSLQENVLTPDKNEINFEAIQQLLRFNKQENYALYATHRGVLGVIDTLLTILASLVVFYPIIYLVQKSRNSVHTFFSTNTEKKVNYALDAVAICLGNHP